jgi:phage N-6-adenine-methyltransferase
LFAGLAARFGGFDLDPAATPDNAKCPRFFTRAEDGLRQPWAGRVWLNPPYGREIAAWVRKGWEAAQTTAELVVCLVPARTDTSWWHRYCALGEVEFLPGRVRFGSASSGAPFPSAVVVFRNAATVTKGPEPAPPPAAVGPAGEATTVEFCNVPALAGTPTETRC